MDTNFSLALVDMQKKQAINELSQCNTKTAQYGLYLSDQQIDTMVMSRFNALKDTGRIEFGTGILKKLVDAFCSSPYISQENYVDTIIELQDIFYYFKNESMERISDDELIEYMKSHFDEECQGSLEYLMGTSLEELCRDLRYGRKYPFGKRNGR